MFLKKSNPAFQLVFYFIWNYPLSFKLHGEKKDKVVFLGDNLGDNYVVTSFSLNVGWILFRNAIDIQNNLFTWKSIQIEFAILTFARITNAFTESTS